MLATDYQNHHSGRFSLHNPTSNLHETYKNDGFGSRRSQPAPQVSFRRGSTSNSLLESNGSKTSANSKQPKARIGASNQGAPLKLFSILLGFRNNRVGCLSAWPQADRNSLSTVAEIKRPLLVIRAFTCSVKLLHVGGCQNYGPLLGPLNTRCHIILRTPKGDHNFDNHPRDMSSSPGAPSAAQGWDEFQD